VQRWIARLLVSLLLMALALIVAGLGGIYLGRIVVPRNWNPFAPYDVRAPSGPLTPLQYWRTVHDPQLCRTALTFTDLRFQPVRDSAPSDGCALQNVVRIMGGTVQFNHPFLATCPLALAVARFATRDLQAAAQASYGQNVREIEHVGSYACRAIRTEGSGSNHHDTATSNHAQNTLSQHAYANAIDISGFVLADGREIAIGSNWRGGGANARFLRAAHSGACDAFNTTLGPDYNALHSAHFHVDMGPYQLCR